MLEEVGTPRQDTPESHLLSGETGARVQDALRTLPPQQRLVFTLRHYEGYKLREIARMMGCREGTVKRYLFDATHSLRQRLHDLL
jgi:RNA polymerase sigma-70 factor (ECF subfamily)